MSSGEELALDDLDDELPPLLQAAKNADVASFKKLMEDGHDVLQKDEDDRTVLHWAAQSGCVPIIMAGVARGLMWHANAKSKRGLTPLHEACLAGYVRTVHVLLAIGADMTSQTQEGYTPLLCAAGNGHNDVTRVLVGAGCDANKLLQTIGVNALHIAAWTDQPEVLDDLLTLGGDMTRKSKMGKTAIDFAIEQSHTDCINVLRKHEEKRQLEFKSQLGEQENFFRAKLNQLADKIHKYYDDRLKQEIEYFEKQLHDLHDRDAEIIFKLKKRINQLLKTELDDHDEEEEKMEEDDRGTPTSETKAHDSLRPDGENTKLSLRRRRRSSQFAHRPRMFSITAQHGLGVHDSSDEDHGGETRHGFERQHSAEVHRQPRRPGSGKTKTMTELVQDASKRKNSVNFIKRQGSAASVAISQVPEPERSHSPKPPGVPTIRLLQPSRLRHTRSTTPSHSMSVTPSNSSLSPSPPPLSPNLSRQRSSSPTSSMADSVFGEENDNHTVLSPRSQPKSRRSSIAAFFRPNFKSNTNDEEKSRRRSVETKIQDQSPPKPQPPKTKKKKGFSIFSVPLPGIPVGMIEEDFTEDIDMEGSGSHDS
ncbi:uncharacterized protein [Diadema antillarum]|uniref:uncharacterized protein n=1 Tax=Diadema antillarum TaxID=105358 RepID=UPI003A8511AE